MQKVLTCICCPVGCEIQVEMEAQQILKITGNRCSRGEAYAKRELIRPSRIVTTTVRVREGERAVVSVKTEKEIPKENMMHCISALKDLEVEAPVHIGDVIYQNIAGTGISMIATANVEKRNQSKE